MTDHIPLPGTGSIADSVEFVKKLWGIPSAGALPGMLIPTLSLEEINKKITDLKAVESWMTVNMNMLRGTIQALEVQSATIVNLQSMGAMFGVPHNEATAAQASAAPGFPFGFPEWPPAAAKSVKPEVKPEPVAAAPEIPEPAPAPVEKAVPPKAAAGAAPNANAWWDLLQNQFKQAVGTAMMPDALKAAAQATQFSSAKSAASKSSISARKGAARPAAKKVSKASAKAKPKDAVSKGH
ncbi:MAG: pilus assembly protein FimV [Herbaspirillum sp.]|jgi:hypothetical protein|nr:pilus assembly protein FimV [Herbaspirillum sp.]